MVRWNGDVSGRVRPLETERLIAIHSFSCPVIKRVTKRLDRNDFSSVAELVCMLILDLSDMPEAAATVKTLERIYKIGEQ